MQTDLAPQYRDTATGQRAEAILRQCVHCGFCNATCPTYQLLGDELDGPRGRIYQIKAVLEGQPATRITQQHLDRCLTCRNCETTCPSGVAYGELLEIGREVVEQQVARPWNERAARKLLQDGLTSAAFGPAVKAGQVLRRWLPASLSDKLPPASPSPRPEAAAPPEHSRQVWLLEGCVQPSLAPDINAAARRVLHRAGITARSAPQAGCCGAIALHLGHTADALVFMRRNIDAWWPAIAQGQVEGLVMTASGCGVTVKDYGRLLAHDPAYAERAAAISQRTHDLTEWASTLVTALPERPLQGLALVAHPPCTLQHGQKLPNALENVLQALGADVRPARHDAHLCCGSAGTYAVLQPELATALRTRKLAALAPTPGDTIVSANVGCIQHLQATSPVPVRHWVTVLDDALRASLPT